MSKPTNKTFSAENQAWILHREEIHTTIDGACNIYVLLDAFSKRCLAQEITTDLPETSKLTLMLESCFIKTNCRPQQILISKADPLSEIFHATCKHLKIPLTEVTATELLPLVKPFTDSFSTIQNGYCQSRFKK
jgi:hypothetical protein